MLTNKDKHLIAVGVLSYWASADHDGLYETLVEDGKTSEEAAAFVKEHDVLVRMMADELTDITVQQIKHYEKHAEIAKQVCDVCTKMFYDHSKRELDNCEAVREGRSALTKT